MNSKPLFSVVTICYNSGNLIRKTIESVLAQKSDGNLALFECEDVDTLFEYVVQDGASTDDTLKIVEEYKPLFLEKNIPLVVNSGKDGGIYDAMNKGVQAANGKYVIFMNSDDCFYSEHVLSDIYKSLNDYTPEDNTSTDSTKTLPIILFGDCIVKELGMYFKFRKCPEQIETRMPFSHQACFARRDVLLQWPLDLNYPITADYDFLLKCHMNKCSFYDTNVIISLVTADGVSSVNMYDAFREACKVCDSYGIPRYTDKEMKNKIFEMKVKQFVLSFFPSFIKKAIRKYQVQHRGQTLEVTIPNWAIDTHTA
ncbi:MAG: glycosyltransferase family 2 protein [Lachnospiraceae bacterium]|nr:glycosyltransferase family 2 protein [Lachnospiraceae bacterium]